MDEKRIKRVKIYGIIGIIYSLVIIGDNLIRKMHIYEIVIACSLFISSIYFVISSNKLNRLNKKKKNSQK